MNKEEESKDKTVKPDPGDDGLGEYEKEEKVGGFWAIMGALAIVLLLVVLCAIIILGFVAAFYGLGYLLSRILPLTVHQAAVMVLLVVLGGVIIIVSLLVLSLQFSARDALEKIAFELEGFSDKQYFLLESSVKRSDADSSRLKVPLKRSSKRKPPN